MTAVSQQQAVGPVRAGPRPTSDDPVEDKPVDNHRDHRSQDRLARLVETHQAEIWRYVRYLGADAAEADDLVQETFLSVARTGFAAGGGGFEERGERQTAGYLRTAARNQLLMLRRRQRRQANTVALEAAETVWAEHASHAEGDGAWAGLLDLLGDCIDKLEGRSRQVIQLQYRDGDSRSEIADKLAMKPDGVKTLLRRTRQVLRECIERTRAAAARTD